METELPEPLKLVILEDDEAHFELMRRIIERDIPSVSITHFTDPSPFLEHADDFDPDVIIVDYLMPGMNGLEFLKELNKSGDRRIPTIMMTGQGSESVAIEAIRLGAWDYLVKSVYFFKLLPSTIDKVIRKRDLRRSLRETGRLNQLLMDSLPHPAMLIRSDRTVLAANSFARKLGARLGQNCGGIFSRRKSAGEKGGNGDGDGPCSADFGKCALCLADEALSSGKPANAPEFGALGRIWDSWWIPVEKDLLFHYALDITERKQTERSIKASIEFLAAANRNSDMAPLLRDFIAELKQFTGCRAAGIRLLDCDGRIPYVAHEGFSPEFLATENLLSINSDRGLCVNIVKGSGAPVPLTRGGACFSNSVSDCIPRLPQQQRELTRSACNQFGYESVALIPIRVGDEIIGLIHLADFEENLFPDHLKRVLERAAVQLGTAIQRVQSEAELRRSKQQLRDLASRLISAQEEERKKIAGELHDGLGSSLSAVKMTLENIRASLGRGELSPDLLDTSVSWTQSAMDEVRGVIGDLRPLMLDDLGLVATLGWFVRQFRSTWPSIHVEEEIRLEEKDIPEALKIVIFRIVQEAFNNAARHSGAEFISLRLVKGDRGIDLKVEDTGEGFDTEAVLAGARKCGLGLTSIKERIECSGGVFSMKSVIGQGSAIGAVWELQV